MVYTSEPDQGKGVKVESSDGCIISPVKVRMLQATKLPAYHRRLVKARAHGSQNLRVPLSLFPPDNEALREKDLRQPLLWPRMTMSL